MDAWSALFIFASSVSLAGLVSSCTGEPTGRVVRERETLKKGIQRSLSDLDFEITRLKGSAADAGEEEIDDIWEEIGRLEEMKTGLIGAEKKLGDTSQEEWNRVRDETLGALDQARRFLRHEGPGPVTQHA
jgi:hypothetical protein